MMKVTEDTPEASESCPSEQTFAKLSVPSYFSANCTIVLDKVVKYS